jgi:ubiquinone/menaquinone biosynthesis C-methylase UbiE
MIGPRQPKVKKRKEPAMDEVQEFYAAYDEDTRLTRDNVHRVEWAVTTAVLDPLLAPGARLLDLGAATGAYALHYAVRGCLVTAVDVVERHVRVLAERAAARGLADLRCLAGDARELSTFADGSFDAVLCFGPLYHLAAEADRTRCIRECLRVLAPGGLLAAAYVSTSAGQRVEAVRSEAQKYTYDCFVLAEPAEMAAFLGRFALTVVDHAAVDGLSRGMGDLVNGLTPEEFQEWIRFTLSICRGPSAFRRCFHGLVVCRKEDRR